MGNFSPPFLCRTLRTTVVVVAGSMFGVASHLGFSLANWQTENSQIISHYFC